MNVPQEVWNYAYVIDWANWSNARVSILDISTPTDPKEEGYYEIPSLGRDIAVFGSFFYVACNSVGLQIYESLLSGVDEGDEEKEKVLEVTQNLFMGTAEVKVQGIKLPAALKVYDVSGRIKEKTMIYNSSQAKIGADLAPGIYFVNVEGLEPVKMLKLR
jgi:hypothetical protein